MELSGFIHSASPVVAGLAIASAWQGLLLAVFLWICLKLTPTLSAGVRFAIWATGFVAVLLLPVLSFVHGFGASTLRRGASSGHPILHLDSRWALAIAAAWAMFAIMRAISLGRNAFRVRTLCRASQQVDVDASLRHLLERVGSVRVAKIHSSAEIDQPCVIGFLKPQILVPEWLLKKATSPEMRQIVLHEASHLRRWDDWTNLLQKLALVAFPLNPALWWIERLLCAAREEACDERVVRETRSPREYAACLTNLAAERMERRFGQRSAALSLGAWEHRSALAERVYSILRGGTQLSAAKARAIMAALLIATGIGAVQLGGTSQLVAFTTSEAPEFAQHAQPIMIPAHSLHDVVFRERPAGQMSVPRVIPATSVSASHRALKPLGASPKKTSAHSGAAIVRRASLSVNETRSWLVVTRWDAWPDRQAPVMIIHTVFRFSTPSVEAGVANGVAAVRAQTGWFVFQL